MSGSGRAHDRRRRRQRAVWWEGWREYANGTLWVMPGIAALLALLTGFAMAKVTVRPGSVLSHVAFQGTADDARSLLIEVTGTVVTVIALTLGLTVVALQLSSTQFSPRLLRNFLRDRGTQVVLSVFIATFVYAAAGSFTVGVESGARTEDYPRLAVSGSIVLLFASLGMVVYYADHLAHSIQIDAITRQVERNTRRALNRLAPEQTPEPPPRAPGWAAALSSRRTGYVQTVHPELLLPLVAGSDATICLRVRVGQHVIAGTVLGWVWASTADDPPADHPVFEAAVNNSVRIGFERTGEQDVAFGLRQLIDIACKALSPAVNDPYTAVQAIDHLSTIATDLAVRSLGTLTLTESEGTGRVIVPGNTFGDYIHFICSMIGRYGGSEVTVLLALVRLLRTCASVLSEDPERQRALVEAAQMVLDDGERRIARPSDLESLRTDVRKLQAGLA